MNNRQLIFKFNGVCTADVLPTGAELVRDDDGKGGYVLFDQSLITGASSNNSLRVRFAKASGTFKISNGINSQSYSYSASGTYTVTGIGTITIGTDATNTFVRFKNSMNTTRDIIICDSSYPIASINCSSLPFKVENIDTDYCVATRDELNVLCLSKLPSTRAFRWNLSSTGGFAYEYYKVEAKTNGYTYTLGDDYITYKNVAGDQYSYVSNTNVKYAYNKSKYGEAQIKCHSFVKDLKIDVYYKNYTSLLVYNAPTINQYFVYDFDLNLDVNNLVVNRLPSGVTRTNNTFHITQNITKENSLKVTFDYVDYLKLQINNNTFIIDENTEVYEEEEDAFIILSGMLLKFTKDSTRPYSCHLELWKVTTDASFIAINDVLYKTNLFDNDKNIVDNEINRVAYQNQNDIKAISQQLKPLAPIQIGVDSVGNFETLSLTNALKLWNNPKPKIELLMEQINESYTPKVLKPMYFAKGIVSGERGDLKCIYFLGGFGTNGVPSVKIIRIAIDTEYSDVIITQS